MLPWLCCLLAFSCLNLPLPAQSSPLRLLTVQIARMKILTPSCCPQESCGTQTDGREPQALRRMREVIEGGESGAGWMQVLPNCISPGGEVRSSWGSGTTSCFPSAGQAESPKVREDNRKRERREEGAPHLRCFNQTAATKFSKLTSESITERKPELIKHYHRNGEKQVHQEGSRDHFTNSSLAQNLPASDRNVNIWGDAPGCILLFQSFPCLNFTNTHVVLWLFILSEWVLPPLLMR